MARYGTLLTPLADGAEASMTLSASREDTVIGLVKTDHASEVYIDQSSDGVNWDYRKTIVLVADVGQGFSDTIYGTHIKITVKNGAGAAQTYLRLSAKFGSAGDS